MCVDLFHSNVAKSRILYSRAQLTPHGSSEQKKTDIQENLIVFLSENRTISFLFDLHCMQITCVLILFIRERQNYKLGEEVFCLSFKT